MSNLTENEPPRAIMYFQYVKESTCTRKAKYIFLREVGFSYKQIAAFLVVSSRTVYNTVNDKKYQPGKKTLDDLEYLRNKERDP